MLQLPCVSLKQHSSDVILLMWAFSWYYLFLDRRIEAGYFRIWSTNGSRYIVTMSWFCTPGRAIRRFAPRSNTVFMQAVYVAGISEVVLWLYCNQLKSTMSDTWLWWWQCGIFSCSWFHVVAIGPLACSDEYERRSLLLRVGSGDGHEIMLPSRVYLAMTCVWILYKDHVYGNSMMRRFVCFVADLRFEVST
jgi:hypothetical protein